MEQILKEEMDGLSAVGWRPRVASCGFRVKSFEAHILDSQLAARDSQLVLHLDPLHPSAQLSQLFLYLFVAAIDMVNP